MEAIFFGAFPQPLPKSCHGVFPSFLCGLFSLIHAFPNPPPEFGFQFLRSPRRSSDPPQLDASIHIPSFFPSFYFFFDSAISIAFSLLPFLERAFSPFLFDFFLEITIYVSLLGLMSRIVRNPRTPFEAFSLGCHIATDFDPASCPRLLWDHFSAIKHVFSPLDPAIATCMFEVSPPKIPPPPSLFGHMERQPPLFPPSQYPKSN